MPVDDYGVWGELKHRDRVLENTVTCFGDKLPRDRCALENTGDHCRRDEWVLALST
jgi:hypothetical protein